MNALSRNGSWLGWRLGSRVKKCVKLFGITDALTVRSTHTHTHISKTAYRFEHRGSPGITKYFYTRKFDWNFQRSNTVYPKEVVWRKKKCSKRVHSLWKSFRIRCTRPRGIRRAVRPWRVYLYIRFGKQLVSQLVSVYLFALVCMYLFIYFFFRWTYSIEHETSKTRPLRSPACCYYDTYVYLCAGNSLPRTRKYQKAFETKKHYREFPHVTYVWCRNVFNTFTTPSAYARFPRDLIIYADNVIANKSRIRSIRSDIGVCTFFIPFSDHLHQRFLNCGPRFPGGHVGVPRRL